MRRRPVLLAAVALLVLSGVAASVAIGVKSSSHPHGSLIALQTRPALRPPFQPGIFDYTARCSTKTLLLSARTSGSASTLVAGRKEPRRRFSVRIPVHANQEVDLAVNGGNTLTSMTRYHIRCLPTDFPRWTFMSSGVDSGAAMLVTPNIGSRANPYVVIFDSNGVPVWWQRNTGGGPPINAEITGSGAIAWTTWHGGAFASTPGERYVVHGLDGRPIRQIRAVGSPIDHHELQVDRHGDAAFISYRPRTHVNLAHIGGPRDATVVDAVIEIVDRRGRLVWTWNSHGHIPLTDTRPWVRHTSSAFRAKTASGRVVYDILHPNSLDVGAKFVLLSCRHADAVYEIDRGSGKILWKLGGALSPVSLRVIGDPYGSDPLSGQHDAHRLPDGTITIHDNETGTKRKPRAVRFRIDAKHRTATFVSEVTDPEVTASPYAGSARRLSDGRWLIAWGGLPWVSTYSPSGRRLSKLTFPDDVTYRAIPLERTQIALAALRHGMDASAR